MAIQNSNQFLVWIDDVQVPLLRNVGLSVTSDNVIVTKGASKGNIERIPGEIDSSISFDAIMDSNDLNRFNNGDRVPFRWGTIDSGFEASASIITSITRIGDTDDLLTYGVEIQTSGAITPFQSLTLVELCDNDGNPLCDAEGNALCGFFRVELVLRELCDDQGNTLCNENGEPLCGYVLNTL